MHIIMNPKKQNKVYVTVLLFILYSIWVHVEIPKYKMICLNHQNQVNLLKKRGQKSLSMFFDYVLTAIQLNFKNNEI